MGIIVVLQSDGVWTPADVKKALEKHRLRACPQWAGLFWRWEEVTDLSIETHIRIQTLSEPTAEQKRSPPPPAQAHSCPSPSPSVSSKAVLMHQKQGEKSKMPGSSAPGLQQSTGRRANRCRSPVTLRGLCREHRVPGTVQSTAPHTRPGLRQHTASGLALVPALCGTPAFGARAAAGGPRHPSSQTAAGHWEMEECQGLRAHTREKVSPPRVRALSTRRHPNEIVNAPPPPARTQLRTTHRTHHTVTRDPAPPARS